jgi:hypothetical protein
MDKENIVINQPENIYIEQEPEIRDLDDYPDRPSSIKNSESKKYRPSDTKNVSRKLFPINKTYDLPKIREKFFALITDYQDDYVKHSQYEKRKKRARDRIWSYINSISHIEDLPSDYMINLRAEIDKYMSEIFYDNYYNNYQFQKYLDALFYFYDPSNPDYEENLAKKTNELEYEAEQYHIGGLTPKKTKRMCSYKKKRKTRQYRKSRK